MLRKTHISIGIATALAVIHPTSIAGCLCAIMGGAIGGWLPDVDLNTRKKIKLFGKSDDEEDYTDYIKNGVYYDPEIYGEVGNDHPGFFHDNDTTQSAIQLLIIIGLTLFIDNYFKNGICDYFAQNFGVLTIIGIILFVGLLILGIHTQHRTFTHSLLGCALFSSAIWLIAKPLGVAFVSGFLAHIIIDILNRKPGNQYLWPFKPRVYMNLVPSDGTLNRILGNIGVILSIFLTAYFFIPCLLTNPKFSELLTFLNTPQITIASISFSGFAVYLIAINILSFVAFMVEHLIYCNSFTWQYSENDSAAVLTTLNLLAYAGGGIGMLLAVLIVTKGRINKGEDGNTTLYIVPIVSILIWVAISILVVNPSGIDFQKFFNISVLGKVTVQQIVLLYICIINILTFLLIMFCATKNKKFTIVETITLLLALLGGASGGYLAMGISNRKMAAHHFSFGLPLMMAIHAIVLRLILYYSNLL